MCGVAIAADITGRWEGVFTFEIGDTIVPMHVTIKMEQNKDGAIMGKYEAFDDVYGLDIGTIRGELSGGILTFELLGSNRCVGRYRGEGYLSQDETQIEYSLVGWDICNDDFISGLGRLFFVE